MRGLLSRECARLFLACSSRAVARGGAEWEEEEEGRQIGMEGFERACEELLPVFRRLPEEQVHALFRAAAEREEGDLEADGLSLGGFMAAMGGVLTRAGVTVLSRSCPTEYIY